MPDWLRSPDYWLLPEFTTHLGFLLALVFLAYLIRQKRSPASTMAWLLLVLFLPYVGVPLYLMFGGRKMNRMARSKARVYERRSASRPADSITTSSRSSCPMAYRPATSGNRIKLLTRGEEAFSHLVRIIDEAKTTIHITTYILGRDDVGKEIVTRLPGVRRRASPSGCCSTTSALGGSAGGSWRRCSRKGPEWLTSCPSCMSPSAAGPTCETIARSSWSTVGLHSRGG